MSCMLAHVVTRLVRECCSRLLFSLANSRNNWISDRHLFHVDHPGAGKHLIHILRSNVKYSNSQLLLQRLAAVNNLKRPFLCGNLARSPASPIDVTKS